MASFIENLWSSIFTAGPTPTLLLATNVSFAALQVLLFVLLLATYSIHFVILSTISGGLWYMINWFAREVTQAQAQAAAEQDKSSEEEFAEGKKPAQINPRARGTPDGADSDTETEGLLDRKRTQDRLSTPQSTSASATLQVPGSASEVRKRLSVSGDSSGYASTDSEWEKVDDGNGN
ncbi:ER protein Pkr1-domain-containing protein [Aspergillus heterothallicus]